MICAPHVSIEAGLQKTFQEEIVAEAIWQGGAALVELYLAPGGKTWTMTIRLPGKGDQECVLGAGTDWRAMAAPAL